MYIHLKGSLKCFRDFNCTAGVFFIIVSSFSFLHVRERNLSIEHMCVHKSRVIPNKPNKPNKIPQKLLMLKFAIFTNFTSEIGLRILL